MANRVKIRRGLKANLPTLSVGEQALCTDTSEIFIGGNTGNIQLANKDYVDTQLAQNTSDLNAHMAKTAADDVHGLLKRVVVRSSTAQQSIPNDTMTALLLPTSMIRDDSLISYDGDTGQFTVNDNKIKFVRVSVSASWSINTLGTRILQVRKNGSVYNTLDGAISQINANAGGSYDGKQPLQWTTSLLQVVQNDHIEISVLQNSGGALTLSNRIRVVLEVFY